MGPRKSDTVARRTPADVTPCNSNRLPGLPRLLWRTTALPTPAPAHRATGGPDEQSDPCRPLPDRVDRRQGIDDPGTRAGGPRRGRAGCSGPVLPGTVLRAVL